MHAEAVKEKKIGRGGKPYTPADAGDGVGFEDAKLKPEIMRRIEWLGQMDDRRKKCLAARNWKGLLQVANEYKQRGMEETAAAVKREANECKHK